MRMGSRKVGDVVETAKKESAVKFTANLLAALTLSLFAALSCAQEKAVYHFDGGVEQATKGLRNSKLKKDQFILGVEFVPSGVVQITHLQQKEGYAYLKP